MKNKVLFIFVFSGFIYLIIFLMNTFIEQPPKPFLFRQEYLHFGAKWFHSKNVKKIVSTEQIGKHKNIFDEFDIEVFRETLSDDPHADGAGDNPIHKGPPSNDSFINLNIFFNFAKRSNSKGIYIQGNFEANSSNIELMQEFINNKGFIYFNSPSDFIKLSDVFIEFIQKNIASDSIAVMDFTKTIHTSGSSIMDNLDYLIQYDNSNANMLIKKLKEQLKLQKEGAAEAAKAQQY